MISFEGKNSENKISEAELRMLILIGFPKNKKEENFLKELLKKMKVETHIVEEPVPNYETIKALEDVENKKGVHVIDSKELFSRLGI